MNDSRVTVIKVGGSLFDWPELPERLTSFCAHRASSGVAERMVLIAGGGSAADAVRQLDRLHRLGEERAHLLALHALDLTAHLLSALLPGTFAVVDSLAAVRAAWSVRSVPILAPRRFLTEIDRHGADPLPETWDVTSDAIAARVAVHLGADCLVLLKSAPLPPGANCRDAARLGLVDPVFPSVARALPCVEYVNHRDGLLQGTRLPP